MRPIIVWRNPEPKWHKQRWQALERRLDRTLYLIQELVRSGDSGHWVTAFAFEVVRGGQRANMSPVMRLPMEVSK